MKTPFTLLAALAFVLIAAAAVVTGSLIAASPALAATVPGAPLDPQTLAWGLAAAAGSTALSALMAEAESILLRGIILVLGNVLIVVLEVMVVSIQTTRLVLFEFFARFLTGAGRPFRPLAPPPTLIDGDLR